MKNKSTILIMALAIMIAFTGCRKNEIDIEAELKELSEETFKGLESKGQVRFEEHSRPKIICPAVHIFLEPDEFVNATYPHLISDSITDDEGNE